ncbi:hypothetical protein SBP28_004358 [Candidozyma auris]
MSLCLRFGAMSFGGIAVAPPAPSSILSGLSLALPRLPTLRQFLPQAAPQVSTDPRLEELKKQIEETGDTPFLIDNGMILRAAPKKRTCPACGHVKRSHFMCMHCFAEIRTFLKSKKKALFPEPTEVKQELDPVDEQLVYPKRRLRMDEVRLREKDWVPKREEPLEYSRDQTRKKW